ncbi:MAG: GGDEF domain-containing protein, partial [Armatimonadota bacterium]
RQEIAAETAELEQRLETARAASHTDHLTSIGNRAAFDYAAAATVQQVRLGNGPYSLALIDLDDFKHINDTFGHPAGDAVLNSVAGLLRTHLGKTSFLGRIGGDEFAIIYPGKIEGLHKSLNNALLQLRRSTITVPSKASLVETRVGFSAGLAVFRGDCMITSIIRAADEALYSSKKSGKGQIQVFDERVAA